MNTCAHHKRVAGLVVVSSLRLKGVPGVGTGTGVTKAVDTQCFGVIRGGLQLRRGVL